MFGWNVFPAGVSVILVTDIVPPPALSAKPWLVTQFLQEVLPESCAQDPARLQCLSDYLSRVGIGMTFEDVRGWFYRGVPAPGAPAVGGTGFPSYVQAYVD